jgi:hypothetical protein
MPRRTLRVLAAGCLVLAACGTSDAAAPEPASTVGDVGVLPGTLPGAPTVPSTDAPAATTGPSAPTSTSGEPAPSTAPRVNDGRVSVGRIAAGNRVLVIGDSILASISDRYGGQLCAELVPRGWVVEVDAEVGRFVRFGRQVLAARPAEDWDVAVVMLGNNYDGDPDDFARELGLLLDELEPLPVVLLSVTRFEPQQDEVNWIVTQAANARADVLLVDWATPTAADAPGSSELLAGDGLHLSATGQHALAERIRRALGNAPAGSEGDCLRSTFRDDSSGSIPADGRRDDTGGDGDGDPGSDDAGTGSARPGRVTTTTAARRVEPEAPATTAGPRTTATPADPVEGEEPEGPAEPEPGGPPEPEPADPPVDGGPQPTPAA